MGKVHVAGIGASAGGLEAITQLVGALKVDTRCAYVVLQHLSPSYRSMMVEILGRETPLRVKELEQGDVPEAGVIYVVPANSNALYKEGHLVLTAASPEVVPKPSINQFLISLASEEGESAIGVVLSGTGSDGTAGLRAIQAAGGFTLVQQPETAKYDGMPRAAIEAGVADHILPPDRIAKQISELLVHAQSDGDAEHPPADLYQQLMLQLRERLKFDFSGYKTGTLLRRIRRREAATQSADLAEYLHFIEMHPDELEFLARDILISVTAFFRDRDAFAALNGALQEIVRKKVPGSEIRIWVAGCASGEEAYSIAILLAEALQEKLASHRIQIFATDVDEDALNVARRGVYPAASMTEIPEDLLRQYFRPVGNAYEAGKTLRDMIVFARHNLVSDPPFLRLDMVSCRNVLIYFDAPLQSKVLQTFHFGLYKESYLFLGRSESVTQAEQLFSAVDRKERLFFKVGDSTVLPLAAQGAPRHLPVQRRDQSFEILLSGLLAQFNVTAVLCDSDGNVLHSIGEVEHFLQFPQGTSRLNLSDVILPELRSEVFTLQRRCQQTGKPQRGRRRRVGKSLLRLMMQPVREGGGNFLVVLFVPEAMAEEPADEVASSASEVLEDELMATREHLQALVEEMATANEEMQALNEEAQASNEELQATNEELEAANEEMQATNEELVSLNEELNVKTAELSKLSEEYVHLYDALEYPVLVFDRSQQLIRFNAPAARRFDLRPSAIRHHLNNLKLPEELSGMSVWMNHALAHGEPQHAMVKFGERSVRVNVTPGLNAVGDVSTLVVSMVDVTDIVMAQNALFESEQRLTSLMAHTTVIFAMRDIYGAYLYANHRFLEFFGLQEADVIGKTDFAILPPEIAASFWECSVNSLRTRTAITSEHSLEQDGRVRHLHAIHQTLFDADGNPVALTMEAEDISARREAEDQLRITAKVFDHAGEAIVVTDPSGVIQTTNRAFTGITGYSLPEAKGRAIGDLVRSGRHSKDFYQTMWDSLTEHGFWQGEIWNRRKDGEVYPEWLTINRVDNEDGAIEHYVAVFSDITDIKNAQRKAEYLAAHDALTGLPNRTLLQDRLRHALAQARRKNERVALMFIDLDNFKDINDTLGHDVGDELLKQVANRLQQVMRDIDTVARLGGDEFTAILSECNEQMAHLVARRIIDELCASFNIHDRQLFVSASVGVAFYPEDGKDSVALLKAADSAMYRAKELGRNRVEFFLPDLHVRLLRRATMESALRAALNQNRLRLVFQPKFSAGKNRQLLGAEALLRWRDPELGDIPPGEFIPISEACGLIVEVTRKVQELLFSHLAIWLKLGLNPPTIAFNCSPRIMREAGAGAEIIRMAKDMDIPPALLGVEITEDALLESSSAVIDNLAELHGHGIQISVDDFGTGYSSLSYLKRLPISELKIDKSFVDGLGQDSDDEGITMAILSLTSTLNLRSVAEGVETEVQRIWLEKHGCDALQGYFLARPMEAAAFEDLLATIAHG